MQRELVVDVTTGHKVDELLPDCSGRRKPWPRRGKPWIGGDRCV